MVTPILRSMKGKERMWGWGEKAAPLEKPLVNQNLTDYPRPGWVQTTLDVTFQLGSHHVPSRRVNQKSRAAVSTNTQSCSRSEQELGLS